ncbi:cDNA sequence BC017133, isoform CRA_b [Mus musculus]|nr:cDNA sequence BC017133, isoform CRA_b [Mus musculus]
MNGSSVASTSPSVKCKEDQGLNGHEEKENPFAEYMWMENEEDFNRQVGKGGGRATGARLLGPLLPGDAG